MSVAAGCAASVVGRSHKSMSHLELAHRLLVGEHGENARRCPPSECGDPHINVLTTWTDHGDDTKKQLSRGARGRVRADRTVILQALVF